MTSSEGGRRSALARQDPAEAFPATEGLSSEISPIRANSADELSRWGFVVGAPRCGTTSLSRYLKSHPDVCFSRVKEPHFFSEHDLSPLATDELRGVVQERYLDRYFAHREPSRLMAEASVTYLYVPERLEPILRLWPDAKFVISIRSPLQMIPSLHQRLFHNGDETVRQFRRAWELVPERRAGRSVPTRCADPRWLDYWEIGQLGKYVKKFIDTIGPERCFISIFDDFAEGPGEQYRKLLQFLGLPDDGRTEFGRHRESLGVRIAWLQRLLKRPPKSAISLLGHDAYRERFGAPKPPKPVAQHVLSIRKRLLKWNRAPAPKLHIDDALLSEMRAMYRDDIALLSGVVGRDLTHWIDG
jgi:hypothetical protein